MVHSGKAGWIGKTKMKRKLGISKGWQVSECFIGAWANTALYRKEAAEVLALLEAHQCVSFGFRVLRLNLGLSKYAVILHLSSRSTTYPLTRNPSTPNQALNPKPEANAATLNPRLKPKPVRCNRTRG